jgi:streptogramin lyase
MKMRLSRSLQAAIVGLIIWGVLGQETAGASVRVVVPNDAETKEGGCACDYPFNVGNPTSLHKGAPSIRTQQIFPASAFSSLPGPMFITQIAFRPAAGTCGVLFPGAAFGPVSFPVKISLSTTQTLANYPRGLFSPIEAERRLECDIHRNPNHSKVLMSCYFDENIGLDSQVVFDGMLTLSSANTTTIGGTTAFDIIINLQHPFLYDRQKGNLLLDVKNFTNPTTTWIDTVESSSDQNVVFRIDFDDVDSPTSDGFDEPNAVGFVTRFQFDEQPFAFTEYSVPTDASGLNGITAGPDGTGTVWFTETDAGKIGVILVDSGDIFEFSVPSPFPGSEPFPVSITAGPDGNLWFTEPFGDRIGRITIDGTFKNDFTSIGLNPFGITVGPDRNMWYTLSAGNEIGTITTGGMSKRIAVPTPHSGPQGITAGPDGNLWFTESNGPRIGRITIGGTIQEFITGGGLSNPTAITAGPDGSLWFAEPFQNTIDRINTNGIITGEFPIPTPDVGLSDITAAGDGNLWFTEPHAGKVGRITTNGVIAEFSIPTVDGSPLNITEGPDGNLWFTENIGNKIGKLQIKFPLSLTVTCTDLNTVRGAFGGRSGQPGFDFRADVNNDGVVDVRDLALVARRLPVGMRCP